MSYHCSVSYMYNFVWDKTDIRSGDVPFDTKEDANSFIKSLQEDKDKNIRYIYLREITKIA